MPVREGKEGKGIILKKVCGFCGERFRSNKQRNQHTNRCKEGKKH